jgi:hypothetical protein
VPACVRRCGFDGAPIAAKRTVNITRVFEPMSFADELFGEVDIVDPR